MSLCSHCKPSGVELLLSHLVPSPGSGPAAALSSNPVCCSPLRECAACGCLLHTAGLTCVCWGLSWAVQPRQAVAAESRAQLLPWAGAGLALPRANAAPAGSSNQPFLQVSFWPVWFPEVVYCRDRWVPGLAQENCWECQVGGFETTFMAAASLGSSLSNHMLQSTCIGGQKFKCCKREQALALSTLSLSAFSLLFSAAQASFLYCV